jgi:alkylation response protein AidB-like acyl-CoA dehydrogenase
MNDIETSMKELPDQEERRMLQDSVRGFLEQNWPASIALIRSENRNDVQEVWQGLVHQGLAALGHDPSEGGLREITLVMSEMGRSACPAPLLGAALFNLLLSSLESPSEAAKLLQTSVQSGTVRFAVAPVGMGANKDAGEIRFAHGQAEGLLRFVDSASHATHLLALSQAHELVIVDLMAGGAQIHSTRALGLEGGSGWSEIRLHNAQAQAILLSADLAKDWSHWIRLALLARAYGAANRAFELVVDYVKQRKQFGQPIGKFQAIQHKLSNNLIALQGCKLTLDRATEAFDLKQLQWTYFSSAALAYAGKALRQLTLENHHAFGAIGYAEEHEAPRHFRRVHLDLLVFGGASEARRDLANDLLDNPNASLPVYDLGPAGNAFREEVAEWLETHWSGDRKANFDRLSFHHREFDPSFAIDLGKTGWIGLGWPLLHGGQERSAREQLAFIEMMERAEAPRIGASVQANALMMHGTVEQQYKYLPEILRGEAMHGMGYSEPEAGSDLASLRTSAIQEGNEWVINGQKIWTTTYWGKYMFLAARTDAAAKPAHAGISMFIVPMDTPGITVKAAETMYDGSFANIFYDNVRIPLENIVGPVNGGWKVLTDALANERGVIGGGIVLKVAHAFNLLLRDIRSHANLKNDIVVREQVGQLAADIEVGRQLMMHCAELAESGTTPPEMGAMSKIFSGELMERFGETALDILGPIAALSQFSPSALRNGRYEQNLRHSLMWVISIGTNEIQRSLIAQRGLGLPR